MFERSHTYDAFYLPGPEEGVRVDTGLALGLQWLLAQPGTPLVVQAKGVIQRNTILSDAVKRYRIAVAAPPHLASTDWPGGAVLAPWVQERVRLAIDDELTSAAAVCVIGWAKGELSTWISGHGARDLRTPANEPPPPTLEPVVRIALEEAGAMINHGNALSTDEDKAYVVRTFQELVRSGHRYEVEPVVAWATAHGWTPAEIPRLREFATGVKKGKRFVLRDPWGPKAGTAKKWEGIAVNENG